MGENLERGKEVIHIEAETLLEIFRNRKTQRGDIFGCGPRNLVPAFRPKFNPKEEGTL